MAQMETLRPIGSGSPAAGGGPLAAHPGHWPLTVSPLRSFIPGGSLRAAERSVCVCVCVCDPMGCSPPGSSVYGIL